MDKLINEIDEKIFQHLSNYMDKTISFGCIVFHKEYKKYAKIIGKDYDENGETGTCKFQDDSGNIYNGYFSEDKYNIIGHYPGIQVILNYIKDKIGIQELENISTNGKIMEVGVPGKKDNFVILLGKEIQNYTYLEKKSLLDNLEKL